MKLYTYFRASEKAKQEYHMLATRRGWTLDEQHIIDALYTKRKRQAHVLQWGLIQRMDRLEYRIEVLKGRVMQLLSSEYDESCAVCGHGFTGMERENRHSDGEGNDIHETCCSRRGCKGGHR